MEKKNDYPMLLATINCSISNENKHLTLDGLLELINNFEKIKDNLSPIQEYAISMIQTEDCDEEIQWFMRDYNISKKDMDSVLLFEPYATGQ